MVRLIQVGMGGMGDTWLRTVLASGEAGYAGFVEVNPDIARAQCRKHSLDESLVFGSLTEAIAAVEADGVLIITPPRFHREQSIAALEARLPVLSEKPLADTMTAAQDIVAAAERTGVLHMVAQNYRYSLPVQTLRSVLQSGRLGAVGSLAVQFYKGPHFGGFRDEMPFPLIIDMSIHHFDMMRYLLGQELESVSGYSCNPAWSWYRGDASAMVAMRFGGGAHVSYSASWCATGKETAWNGDWRFDCAGGVLALAQDQVTLQETGAEPEAVALVQPQHTGQAYLLHEFVQALGGGPGPATTCQDNIRSLGIVFATLEAMAAG